MSNTSNNDKKSNDKHKSFFWWVLEITFHKDEAMVLITNFKKELTI